MYIIVIWIPWATNTKKESLIQFLSFLDVNLNFSMTMLSKQQLKTNKISQVW